jgi:hypothetical protein
MSIHLYGLLDSKRALEYGKREMHSTNMTERLEIEEEAVSR